MMGEPGEFSAHFREQGSMEKRVATGMARFLADAPSLPGVNCLAEGPIGIVNSKFFGKHRF